MEVVCPIPYSLPAPIETNLPNFLLKKFLSFPQETALTNASTGETFTFARLICCCVETKIKLESLGFEPNDKIAVVSRNCPEYVILQLALGLTGCVDVDINTSSIAEEVVRMCAQSDVKWIICQKSLLPIVSLVARKIFTLEEIMSDLPTSGHNYKSYSVEANPNCRDPFLMQFSSGTTGFPKSAIISHSSRIMNTLQMSCPGFGAPTIGDVTLLVLPLYHSYSSSMLHAALYNGCHCVIVRKFKRSKFVDVLEAYQVTHLPVVPPIALFLSSDETIAYAKTKTLTLKHVVSAAATISPTVLQKIKENLGIAYVGQLYGMTEIHIATYTPANCTNFASLGVPVPGVVCKIVNEHGELLGPHCTGEFCVKSPGANPGYYKNERATNELIDRDGWYHTGDLMYYDENNFIYYVNRLKEIIKFNGIQVSPSELEGIILTHWSVYDCVVFGIPHAKYGEVPTAFVVLKPNESVSETSIQHFVAGHVAHYKQLRGGVHFITEIPRSQAGKIARNKLKLMLNQSKL